MSLERGVVSQIFATSPHVTLLMPQITCFTNISRHSATDVTRRDQVIVHITCHGPDPRMIRSDLSIPGYNRGTHLGTKGTRTIVRDHLGNRLKVWPLPR